MKYRYSIERGIKKSQSKIKRYVIGSAVAFILAGAAAVPAFSATNASPCGAVHGAFANINGNFRFLGADGGTPGYHGGAVGQDPSATGYNNSNTNCQQ